MLQKSFTTDFLTKKKKLNEGEIPQYYVTGNHEAIIEPEVFDMVQRELARRGKGRNRHSGVHAFSGKIKCGTCGHGSAPRFGIATTSTVELFGNAITNLTAKNALRLMWEIKRLNRHSSRLSTF
ncbi:hypothetical protein [uncultured Selenomonas sp.]|uniref:hypothetical protein n=1 Tax=uncultured Selenomonas sp. TaxID=159275 RepID=UPI0028E6CBA9|nr:hypothetical protein [uncultured Selenomonas sp.]